MSKHTVGPWTLNKKGRNPIVGFDCKDGGELLPIVHTVGGMNDRMAMANARLISAAPDLLEACRAAVETIEQLIPEPSARGVADVVLFQLRAAIAKAEKSK